MNTNAAKTLRCPACAEPLALSVSEGERDLYLCSKESSFVTGAILPVDGGLIT